MSDKRIKVLHIIPSFASGGAERVLLGYLKDFKDDNDIELYALALGKKESSIFDKEIEESNLHIEYAEVDISSRFSFFKRVIAVRKSVKKIKPDIIHSHLRTLPYVVTATLFKKVKRIHTIHSVPKISSAGKILFLDTLCFRRFKVLPICLNKEFANEAKKLYKIDFCEFLYNGIDIEKYQGLQNKEQLRNEFGIPKDAFVLGHVGRFVPIKNHKFIIDVFNNIIKENSNSYLLLVGEGPEQTRIKQMCIELGINNNVIFVGTRMDVNNILQIMNAFIFPSINEGLGIALIEAQAAALRCVASDTIPKEAIVSSNAILLSLDDPEEWSRKLTDKEHLNSGFSGIENFSIVEINKKLKDIYLNI